jgi:hypothetical protein
MLRRAVELEAHEPSGKGCSSTSVGALPMIGAASVAALAGRFADTAAV